MEVLKSIARTSRSARSSLGLTFQRLPMLVSCGTKELYDLISANAQDCATISFAASCQALDGKSKPPEGCLSKVISPDLSIHMPLKGLDLGAELVKAEKQQRQLQQSAATLEKATSAPGYAERTKPEIQAEHKEKLANLRESLAKVVESIANFNSLMTPEMTRNFQALKMEDLKNARGKSLKSLQKSMPKKGAKINDKTRASIEELQQALAGYDKEISAIAALLGTTYTAEPIPQLGDSDNGPAANAPANAHALSLGGQPAAPPKGSNLAPPLSASKGHIPVCYFCPGP
jgi:hypothetical protein